MADTILVLFIVLSAYLVRGITGFGSGLIAVPLLALSHPLQFAVPLVLALDFTASLVLGGAMLLAASIAVGEPARYVARDVYYLIGFRVALAGSP